MGALVAFKQDSVIVQPSPFNLDIIERFLSGIDVTAKSKKLYRAGGVDFVRWLNKEGITWPERADVLKYKEGLRIHQANTVSAYMSAVRGLFNWLEKENLYPNIATGIKGLKTAKGFKKDVFSVEQLKDILEGIDKSTLWGCRDVAMLNLMVRTGLRTIELSRASIEDIRIEGGDTLLYVQGKGRDSADEFVILTPVLVDLINAYLTARNATTGPLFVAHDVEHNGMRLSAEAIGKITKNRLRNAGIDSKRLTAHSFRHTAITFALKAGASIMEVKEMARHSNVNTTMIYARVIGRRDENAPERRIDDFLR